MCSGPISPWRSGHSWNAEEGPLHSPNFPMLENVFMDYRGAVPLGLICLLALTHCASLDSQTVWPEPRPLGRDLPASQPQPPVEARLTRDVREPTGVVTLAQVQAQALLQNPRLAAFGWEVRAREAQILQAGLLPNPEVDVEVENF